MIRAHGLDATGHQGFLNLSGTKWSFDFFFNKLSEGLLDYIHNHPDEKRKAKNVQILEESQRIPIQGGYHYLRSDYRWKDQADTYLEVVAKLQDNGIKMGCHMLDGGESANNVMSREFANYHYEWWRYVDKNVEGKLFNYHSLSTAHELFNFYGHTWHDRVPHMTAQFWYDLNERRKPEWNPRALELRYNGKQPTLWNGRKGWDIWQVTGLFPGKTEGITGSLSLDYNIYNGTYGKMRRDLGLRTAFRRFYSFRNNRIRMA